MINLTMGVSPVIPIVDMYTVQADTLATTSYLVFFFFQKPLILSTSPKHVSSSSSSSETSGMCMKQTQTHFCVLLKNEMKINSIKNKN